MRLQEEWGKGRGLVGPPVTAVGWGRSLQCSLLDRWCSAVQSAFGNSTNSKKQQLANYPFEDSANQLTVSYPKCHVVNIINSVRFMFFKVLVALFLILNSLLFCVLWTLLLLCHLLTCVLWYYKRILQMIKSVETPIIVVNERALTCTNTPRLFPAYRHTAALLNGPGQIRIH